MPQLLADDPHVDPLGAQLRRVGVPQAVRVDALGDSARSPTRSSQSDPVIGNEPSFAGNRRCPFAHF